MPAASNEDLPQALETIRTRALFRLCERVPPLYVVGETPDAFRRIGVIAGGSFAGDRLSGKVISGNDWQSVRSDSCTKLDVRLLLQTTDGALIAMTYWVLRHGPPEVTRALDRGDTVDPASYYFRLSGSFETASLRYDWLNRVIALGLGDRRDDGPLYNIFEVL